MQIHSPEVLFFIQISKYNSFSEAADKLNIPQPTVSRKISSLESALGKQLFTRSKAGIALTGFGLRFLQSALRVETELENLKRLAMGTEERNIVELEALPALAEHLVKKVLPHFREQNADILVNIQTIPFQKQFEPGEKLRLHTQLAENTNRTYHHYLSSKLGFYSSEQLMEQVSPLTAPEELISYRIPWVSIKSQPSSVPVLDKQAAYIVDNALLSAEATVNGLGVSWNYATIMDDYLRTGQVIELFKNQTDAEAHAYLSYPPNKQFNKAEQLFVDYMANMS